MGVVMKTQGLNENYCDVFPSYGDMYSSTYYDPVCMDACDTFPGDTDLLSIYHCDFNLVSLCAPRFYVRFTDSDARLDTSLPTTKGYDTIVIGTVNSYPIDILTIFRVILNSGTSLAINPRLENFAGPITLFQDPKLLGGMTGDLSIEGQTIIKFQISLSENEISSFYRQN